MKKLLFLLLTTFLLLGACGNQENASSETDGVGENNTEENVETENKANESDENENNEVAETPAEQPEETELFTIQQNPKSKAIELVDPQGKTTVLTENAPSEIIKSPNGEMAAYISPHEWEEPGDLYIVDLKNGKQKKLVEADAEGKPKNVIWQDDDHVLVIIGYPYGTVATGGNIFKVNVKTAEQEAVTNYGNETQITDFHIEDGILHYSGIQYTDEDMIDHKEYSNQIKLETE